MTLTGARWAARVTGSRIPDGGAEEVKRRADGIVRPVTNEMDAAAVGTSLDTNLYRRLYADRRGPSARPALLPGESLALRRLTCSVRNNIVRSLLAAISAWHGVRAMAGTVEHVIHITRGRSTCGRHHYVGADEFANFSHAHRRRIHQEQRAHGLRLHHHAAESCGRTDRARCSGRQRARLDLKRRS